MNNSTELKADFQRSTYPLIRFFNPSISEREYTTFLLRRNSVIGPDSSDEFYVVLNSCPRNQGAIRILRERVSTRLDVCTNPFRFWSEKICGGSKSMIEPNAILGPFRGGRNRTRRRDVLMRVKNRMVDARGIPQRLACMMQIAQQERVWLMTVIPPVLPTSQLDQFFTMLDDTSHDGIFAKQEADM